MASSDQTRMGTWTKSRDLWARLRLTAPGCINRIPALRGVASGSVSEDDRAFHLPHNRVRFSCTVPHPSRCNAIWKTGCALRGASDSLSTERRAHSVLRVVPTAESVGCRLPLQQVEKLHNVCPTDGSPYYSQKVVKASGLKVTATSGLIWLRANRKALWSLREGAVLK